MAPGADGPDERTQRGTTPRPPPHRPLPPDQDPGALTHGDSLAATRRPPAPAATDPDRTVVASTSAADAAFAADRAPGDGSDDDTLIPTRAVTPRPGSSDRPSSKPSSGAGSRRLGSGGGLVGSVAAGTLAHIGPYTIQKELGRGGMGVVYRATHDTLRRDVALKVMIAGALSTDMDRQRFLREAEACANLKHPNIVAVHDIDSHDGNDYFTMDFVEGATLRDWVRERKRADAEILAVLVKVCDAVQFAHARGIIHRDLKPVNIMMDARGEPHVMDFGLAKQMKKGPDAGADSSATIAGAILGTPYYMPPEQARGDIPEIDNRCDIYALGVILYELITGHLPISGGSILEILEKIEHLDPEPLRKHRPDVSIDLQVIVEKAMAKEKARRYPSAQELGEDLERFLRHEPIRARPSTILYRGRKYVERHGVLSAMIAVFLACAAAGGSVFWQERRQAAARAASAAEDRVRLAEAELRAANDLARAAPPTEAGIAKATIASTEAVGKFEAAKKDVSGDRAEQLTTAKNELARLLEMLHATKAANDAREADRRRSSELVAEADAALAGVKPETLATKAAVGAAKAVVAAAQRKLFEASIKNPENAKVEPASERATGLASSIAVYEQKLDNAQKLAGALESGRTVLTAARAAADATHAGLDEAKDEAVAKLFEQAAASFDEALRLAPEGAEAKQGLVDAVLGEASEDLERRSEVGFILARSHARRVEPLAKAEVAELLRRVHDAELALHDFDDGIASAKKARVNGELEKAKALFTEASRAAPERRELGVLATVCEAGLEHGRGHHDEEMRLLEQAERDVTGLAPADVEDVAREEKRCREELADLALVAARAARDRFDYQAAALEIARTLSLRPKDPAAARLESEIAAKKDLGQGLVYVAEGAFPYGPRGATRDEAVKAFVLGATEVTNAEFAGFVEQGGYADDRLWDADGLARRARFVDATGAPGPLEWAKGRPPAGADALPVAGVSWYEARAFARWRRMRLPRDVEWEKAATWDPDHGRKVFEPWSSEDAGEAALAWRFWEPYFSGGRPKRAEDPAIDSGGERRADRSPAGVLDMYGNLSEWTDDVRGGQAVIRGGSFLSRLEARARPTRVHLAAPELRVITVGFRLATEPGSKPPGGGK